MTQTDVPALSAFLARLLLRSRLTDAEQEAILALPSREVPAPVKQDLVAPGAAVDHAILVQDGLLGRFDLMSSGARQITALHIPGDMCDIHSVVAPIAGWGITALAGSVVRHVAHDDLKRLARLHPNIALAFWRDTTLDASVLAKWTANIGRKNARARVAHLLCETGLRMELAGLGRRDDYPLDLTQEQIGDVLGLTGVHVNRTVRALLVERLASVQAQRVEIFAWDALAAIAEFTDTYLLCGPRDEREEGARLAPPAQPRTADISLRR